MKSSKTALITGATSGIGRATAQIFADHNINLIICGRREEKLQELKQELEKKVKVHTLCFDVSEREAVFSSINSLPNEWKNSVNILVNNAGNAHGLAPFQDASLDDFEAMIDSNVKGLINVSKAVIPFLIKNKPAHIVNVSSIAGKETYPNASVYCASKHAVESISQGMRMDLLSEGVKVSNVAPGAVETEFSIVRFKGDQERAKSVYQGYQPLAPQDIADAIYFVVSRPENVQIADISVLPKAQASVTVVNRN